jgi:hypothetical protein
VAQFLLERGANAEAKDRALAVTAIPRYFARVSDKKAAAQAVEQALAEYLSTPAIGVAAWTTIGRLRMEAGDGSAALDAALAAALSLRSSLR